MKSKAKLNAFLKEKTKEQRYKMNMAFGNRTPIIPFKKIRQFKDVLYLNAKSCDTKAVALIIEPNKFNLNKEVYIYFDNYARIELRNFELYDNLIINLKTKSKVFEIKIQEFIETGSIWGHFYVTSKPILDIETIISKSIKDELI